MRYTNPRLYFTFFLLCHQFVANTFNFVISVYRALKLSSPALNVVCRQFIWFCYASRSPCGNGSIFFSCLSHLPSRAMFSSLCQNTEQISMKFVVCNHYHEQIKWLQFGQNWNRNLAGGQFIVTQRLIIGLLNAMGSYACYNRWADLLIYGQIQ